MSSKSKTQKTAKGKSLKKRANKNTTRNNNKNNINKNKHYLTDEDIKRIVSDDIRDEINPEITKIEENEKRVLDKISKSLKKEKERKKKALKSIYHFTFNDFSQIVIGCCVFGLPTFINTSFWDYIPLLSTRFMLYIHIFLMGCVVLALNYEFRDDVTTELWFIKLLMKRFFYTYFSVLMVVVLLMTLVGTMRYSMQNYEVMRNFLAAQSVGIFGAITYTFLKK